MMKTCQPMSFLGIICYIIAFVVVIILSFHFYSCDFSFSPPSPSYPDFVSRDPPRDSATTGWNSRPDTRHFGQPLPSGRRGPFGEHPSVSSRQLEPPFWLTGYVPILFIYVLNLLL